MKPCVICAKDIPDAARMCTECKHWQSPIRRLFSFQSQNLVTLLPVFTLCLAFLAQVDLLWKPRIKAYALTCTVVNPAGKVRQYQGATLVLSRREEPLFLSEAYFQGTDQKRLSAKSTVYGDKDSAAAYLISPTPIQFKIDIAEDTLETILCAGNATHFDVWAQVLSLNSTVEKIKIGLCKC
jgi:hypothetical protein